VHAYSVSLDRDPGLGRTHLLLAQILRAIAAFGRKEGEALPEVHDVVPWLYPVRERRRLDRDREIGQHLSEIREALSDAP